MWKTIWRVVKRPVQVVSLFATIAAVPAAWFHWLSRDWTEGALTLAVILLLSAISELYKESKRVQEGPESPTMEQKIEWAAKKCPELTEMADLAHTGDRLWHRSPHETNVTTLGATGDLKRELAEWKRNVSNALTDFPADKKDWSKPVFLSRAPKADDPFTQEVYRRLILLKTFMVQYAERSGRKRAK